ncbi:MAG: hypothetical protein MMC23_007798 [Stictis urceolatum]|nr:hypothetical protein [Stictis urceolata]
MPPRKRAVAQPKAPQEKKPRQSKLAKENNISAAEETEIKEAFALFSTSHSEYPSSKEGVIPSPDVRRALAALGAPASSHAELRELIETVDPDESGYVPYEHFVAIAALKLQSRTEDQEREEVEAAFRLFTGRNGGDKITMGALRRVARELKESVDEQVLKDMINEANGGAGAVKGVEMDEFEAVMKRAGVFR